MKTSLIHKMTLLLLALSLYSIQSIAQEENKAMFVHGKNGGLHAVFFSEVDSIVYSRVDIDSVLWEDYVTQEIWTPDTVLRIPLNDIQDISFQTPETEYKSGVVVLDEKHLAWIVGCDSLTLFYKSDVPTELLPHVGDKLVTTDMNDVFPTGFIGQVASVDDTGEGIKVECNEIMLSDVFDRYYCVVEGVCEKSPDGKMRMQKARSNYTQPLPPITYSNTIEFDAGWKASEYCELGVGINAEYSLEIQPTLRFVYANEYGDQFVSINFDFDNTFTTACNLFGYFNVEKEFSVSEVSIPVEAVPLTKFYLKAGPRFEFGGDMAFSFLRSDRFRTGYFFTRGTNPNVEYSNGFKKLKRVDDSQRVTMAVGSLSLYGGLFIEVGYGLLIEDWGKVYARFDAGLELTLEADLGKSVDDAAFSTALYDRADDLLTLGLDFRYGPSIGVSTELGALHAGIGIDLMETIELFKKGLFPKFEETRFISSNNRDGQLSFEAGGDMLASVPVGFRVLDENNKEVACEWFDRGVVGPAFSSYEMPFQIPSVNKTYVAYPVFKFLDKYEILASPSVTIGVETTPATDEFQLLSNSEVALSGHIEGQEYLQGLKTSVGFFIGTNQSLQADGKEVYSTLQDDGSFSSVISGLEEETTYYYCAFLRVDNDYLYGEVNSFETPKIPEDAVDLGLSVLWAKWNVGANSESELGGLYGWADPTGTNTTYDVMNESSTVWVSSLYGGTTPPANICGTSLDIATAKWGGNWRLPTEAEMAELIKECSWEWTVNEGISGMMVTGPNGNSIFLPAGGDRFGTDQREYGEYGYYWTGTLNTEETRNAYRLEFDDWGAICTSYARYIGHLVRPVMNKPQ